jgi:hypothetical protein
VSGLILRLVCHDTCLKLPLIFNFFSILASRQKQNLDSYVTEELFGGQGMEAIKNIISCVRQVRSQECTTGRRKAFLFVILIVNCS